MYLFRLFCLILKYISILINYIKLNKVLFIATHRQKNSRGEDPRLLKGVYEEKSFHFFYCSDLIIQVDN